MADTSLELEAGRNVGTDQPSGRWRGWVLPVAALVAWWYVARNAGGTHGILVSPAHVWHTAIDQAASGALWRALSALLGVSKLASRAIGPSFNTFKQVSLFAWIPLISVWFGLGDVAKVVFLSLAALVPVVVHTCDGIRTVPAGLLEVARVYGY